MDSPTMLMIPSPTLTVNVTPFHSASTSPYITAPSSPRHRAAAADPSDDFAFDFSGELDRKFLPADELFDGGVIRPLSTRPTKPKASRSLSPVRIVSEPEPEPNPPSWYKKWRISDLFRSASESRAIDERSRQQRKKYYPLLKKPRREELSNSKGSTSSFRSVGSESSRRTRSGPLVSAHEVHYTINRANSQEMKRRTFLPYRQGLLGCLGFHHPQLYKQRV